MRLPFATFDFHYTVRIFPSTCPGGESTEFRFDQQRSERLRSTGQEFRTSTCKVQVDGRQPKNGGDEQIGRTNFVHMTEFLVRNDRLVTSKLRDRTEEGALWWQSECGADSVLGMGKWVRKETNQSIDLFETNRLEIALKVARRLRLTLTASEVFRMSSKSCSSNIFSCGPYLKR